MGQISVRTNPLESSEYKLYSYSGPFIDWLQKHFPQGFHGLAIVIFNGHRLETKDFDVEINETDDCALFIYPGITTAAIVTAIVSAAVSIAIKYAITWLSGTPDGPNPNDTGQPSPVYSLSTPTNQARLGQAMPVIYGKVLDVPDIASQPYSWYEDNDQYLGMILCIGLGQHQIHSVQIADTPVMQLQSGVVTWNTFQPEDHNQQAGYVYDQTGIWENIDTSPEVSDQELLNPSVQKVNISAMDIDNNIIAVVGSINSGIGPGDKVNITEASPNNGQFTIQAIAGDYTYFITEEDLQTVSIAKSISETTTISRTNSAWIEFAWTTNVDWGGADLVGADAYISYASTGQSGSYYGRVVSVSATNIVINDGGINGSFDTYTASSIQIQISEVTDGGIVEFLRNAEIGPYNANKPGTLAQKILCNVLFPGGLYRTDDEGNLLEETVSFKITYQEVDSDGNEIGIPIVATEDVSRATNTPQRISIYEDLTPAQYKVSMERTDSASTLAKDKNTCIWTGLSAFIQNSSNPVWEETTLIALKIKATDGIASDATNRVGVWCTRILDGIATANPADAYYDIYTNQLYSARRPESEIDLTTLESFKSKWSLSNGFNAVFDQKVSVWDALRRSIQVVNAYPITVNGQVSIIEDSAKTTVTMAFSDDKENYDSDSLSISYTFDELDDTDGYEVEYRNNVDFLANYATYPANAVDPTSVTLWGCTCSDLALNHAQLLWQKQQYRRKAITFNVELEGNVLYPGSLISMQHYLILDGTTSENYVVESVAPKDEFMSTVVAIKYDARVFDGIDVACGD